MKVDVAIIGTGPGGGMAACQLARSGLKVVILEKSKLPRHKPCGGAMPTKITRLLDWDLSPQIEARITQQKFFYNYGLPVTLDKTAEPMLLVSRQRFDHHFIERAVQAGNITLREEFTVMAVEETSDKVTIRGKSGEIIEVDYLIAADGASSRTARDLGLSRGNHIGAAVDVEIEVRPDVYEMEKDNATFNFSCLPDGYGWIFPKAGYLSCGVAAWRNPDGLPRQMKDYLARSLPDGAITAIRQYGHPIPLYARELEIATRRVCLVGDAARLVDPLLGEGIYYAVYSGALAAEVILNLCRLKASSTAFSQIAIDPRFTAGSTLSDGMIKALFLSNPDCRIYQKLVGFCLTPLLNRAYTAGQAFLDSPEAFYRRRILSAF